VDLRAAAGSPVLAAADGVVAFAGSVAGRPVVSVDHADGIRTTYEPVTPAVSAGERVRAGAVLGVLEPTGSHCAPGSCLHWGARRGPVAYVDPLGLLRAEIVIRLYPVR
jgi:murein DD-endopeptidase MepM/ murein hydrolase activator NlpD